MFVLLRAGEEVPGTSIVRGVMDVGTHAELLGLNSSPSEQVLINTRLLDGESNDKDRCGLAGAERSPSPASASD